MADDIFVCRLTNPVIFTTRSDEDYARGGVPAVFGGVLPQDLPALQDRLAREAAEEQERLRLLAELRRNHG